MVRRPSIDVEGVLLPAEELVRVVSLDRARIAVTSHRVLVFDPEGPGRRFDHVYHPNVDDIAVTTIGGGGYVARLPRAIVYGAIFLGGGWLLQSAVLPRLDASVPDTGAGVVGSVTDVLTMVQGALSILAVILLVLGGITLIAAGAFAALYIARRQPALVIEVAGDRPIACRTTEPEARTATSELTAALDSLTEPEPVASPPETAPTGN